MDVVKVYVIENKDPFAVCPDCGAENSIQLSQMQSNNIMVLDCQCGKSLSVFVDRRKFYRKPVQLTGICFASGDPDEGVLVRILDISLSGVSFIKDSGKELAKGEIVRLTLRLGDHADLVASLISVINIRTDHIGCKFMALDEHTRKLLGFFLRP